MKSWGRFIRLILPVLALLVTLGVADAVLAKTPQVAAGKDFTITLRSDGTLWASGSNDLGQLGDGTVLQRNTPVQAGLPGNGTNWTAIAAGDSHCVALKGDGTLWSWGDNSAGQLGNGTIGAVPTLSPVQVGSGTDWVAVAAGMSSTVALKSDGSLWAWGFNDFGQLGNGDIGGATQPSPVAVLRSGNKAYTAVSITHKHVLALQSDGTLWSWGSNQFGQLGINTIDGLIHATPVQFITGDQAVDNAWTAVSAGGGHSLALQAGGTIWSWGLNSLGQLGSGSGNAGSSPAPAKMGADVDWAGFSAGEIHTVAFKRNGTLWTWGANTTGQLGIGGSADLLSHNLPVQITTPAGIGNIIAVAAGPGHALAAKANGDLFAWGDNLRGQFGTGSTVSSTVPVPVVQDSTHWVAVEPGGQHTLARRSDGTLWAWGDNFSGQSSLDPLATTTVTTPVQVGTGTNWSILTGGFLHSVAIRADGTLWNWGSNESGQLGDGSVNDSFVPLQITVTSPVSLSNDWFAVSAGDSHTLALKNDGSLWAWGDNSSGQLGDGTTVAQTVPKQIVTNGNNPGNFDYNWVAVSAGGAFSVGLQADGTLWAWGDNSFGQFAVHPFDVSSSPVPFQILNFAPVPGNPGFNSNWTGVTAGFTHLLGLQGNGTAWGLGANDVGQLGNGSFAPFLFDFFQVQNIGLPSVPYVALAAGDSHSVALKADGSIWSFGNNTSGQLGIGTTDPDILHPVVHAVPAREISNASDWATISAGGRHTVAIKTDGSLASWGENDFGQLGNGTTISQNTPTPLDTIMHFTVNNPLAGSLQGATTQVVPVGASAATVTAVASSGYTFVNWIAPSSGFVSSNAALTVTNNTPITQFVANFASISVTVARIGTNYFTSLQEAYNAAVTGDTIQLYGGYQPGTLLANRPIDVTVSGGWDAGYTANLSMTTIYGMLALQQGKVVMKNVTVVPTSTVVITNPNPLPGYTIGSGPYSATITATGGVAPYSYTVTAGALPAGLTLASGGLLSGTPTLPGTYNFTIRATDSAGVPVSGNKAFMLTILPAPLAITTFTLPNSTANSPYSQTVAASGGIPPYTNFAVTAGALPDGLLLNASTGEISGTPTTAGGPTNFTVTVTDSTLPIAATASQALSLTVQPALAITTLALPNATANNPYSQPVVATGGVTPYTNFAVTVGVLPDGLAINPATGVISGTPTTAGGPTNFTVTVTDSTTPAATASQALSLTVQPALAITTLTLPNATANSPYSQPVVATGGVTPYTLYAVTVGVLPDGLSINPTTGVISGTPTTPGGPTNFTVTVTDSTTPAATASQALSFTVQPALAITTLTLPDATANSPYSQTVVATGGVTPYTNFAVTVGVLPDGLAINPATGVISGTPSTAGGPTGFTVTVTDSTTPAATANQALTLTVQPALAITTVALPDATANSPYSQTVTASGGVTPYTNFSVTVGVLPDGLLIDPATGVISGTPTTAGGPTGFTVTVTDSTTPAATVSQALTVTVL